MNRSELQASGLAVATEPAATGAKSRIAEHAVRGGIASGRARRAKALNKAPLDLTRVEQELGPLDSLDDAQRWLRQIALWAAGGLLHGVVANACVRSVEIFVRTSESKMTREVVGELRGRLDVLESQIARQRLGRFP